MTRPRFWRIVEATSVLLFLVQALRVSLAAMFGIIYDQIFAGTPTSWLPLSLLLLVLCLAAPLAAPRIPGRRTLALAACVAALARIALSVDSPDARYWGGLVVIAAGSIYLASLFSARRSTVLPALLAALAADQLLRAMGQTYDLSLHPSWLPFQISWTAVVLAIAAALSFRTGAGDLQAGQLGGRAGLGLGGFLFLELSLLSLPNAAARWSETSYALLAPLLLTLTFIPQHPFVRHVLASHWLALPPRRTAVVVLLPVALLGGYFLTGTISAALLLIAQALALAAAACLLDGLPYAPRPVGPSLAFGMLAWLILNFANAFAFTYPYAVPAMRGMGWAVYLAACLAIALGVLPQRRLAVAQGMLSQRGGAVIAAGLVAVASVVVAVWPIPVRQHAMTPRMRLATYNIHYGFDEGWHFNLDGMADAIAQEQVDAIALQEVDTGRLTSLGVDDAYFLARRLGMQVAYLPTVEHLTGIAVLYRGEAQAAAALLPSLQEQTGIIRVTWDMPEGPWSFFGTWLGLENEDKLAQGAAALDFIGASSPAAFGGDFNATDGTPLAELIRGEGFVDPFTELGQLPPPGTSPAVDPQERIDYVWLRGALPGEARVAESLASDHRMVVVQVDRAQP
jgi:endonuclease/exonuclease/phosphatase family metal-dependent hydrolase